MKERQPVQIKKELTIADIRMMLAEDLSRGIITLEEAKEIEAKYLKQLSTIK